MTQAPNTPCKNNCGNIRRNGSAYCQECSDKYALAANDEGVSEDAQSTNQNET